MTKRLGVLTTHPIQYHTPWFRALASHPELDLEVFFCHRATPREQAHAGFDFEFDWDVSLLDGYPHRFLKNVSAHPGVSGFNGLDTPEIGEVIKLESFDLVLINGWHYQSAWQAMLACWKTKTPVMVRSDSHLHTHRSPAKMIAKWPMYRWFIPKLDACIAVGQWSREYFLHYGAQPEKIFTIPHVVDDYFGQEAERLQAQRNKLRTDWSLEPYATVFLFVGKFIEKKRPMDLLKAIHWSLKRGSNVAGLMVGDGPLRASCEEFVRSEKLPVEFSGFLNQSEISKAYVAADALVLPSDGGETWGLVVNEAMSCGLPAFVSDQVGCGPDMIIGKKTGYVFPMGDHVALGGLVSSFGGDERKREVMSKRAKQLARSYSPAVAAEATIEAVRAVAKNRKRVS